MTFEDLEAWKQARRLAREVYVRCREEKLGKYFGLRDLIQRAVVSVMTNVAEGSERTGTQEKLHFYNIALRPLGSQKFVFMPFNQLRAGASTLDKRLILKNASHNTTEAQSFRRKLMRHGMRSRSRSSITAKLRDFLNGDSRSQERDGSNGSQLDGATRRRARASAGEARSLLCVDEDNFSHLARPAADLSNSAIGVGKLISGLIASTHRRTVTNAAAIATLILLPISYPLYSIC